MYMSLCRQYLSVHIRIGYNATKNLATRPLVKPAGRCSLASRQAFAIYPLACCEPDSLRGFSCCSAAISLETNSRNGESNGMKQNWQRKGSTMIQAHASHSRTKTLEAAPLSVL